MRSPAVNLRSTPHFSDACEGLLAQGCTARFRAEGWSMYPAIPPGSVVDVVPVRAEDIRLGDVLLCRVATAAVAHRVVRIQGAAASMRIVVRGDASFGCDAAVGPRDIQGKVIAVSRNGVRRRIDTPAARLMGLLVARLWRIKRALAELSSPAPF